MEPDETVETRYGPVQVWGRRTDPARPALFAIGGMFPPRNQLAFLHDHLPDHDVIRVQLPGMRDTPLLSRGGLSALGQAFSDVVAATIPAGPVIALGTSVGCWAALATRHYERRIDRMVLVEPFFRPADTWPMRVVLRDYLPKFGPEMKVWAQEMLGYGGRGIDYRPLLAELPPRTDVILGGVPLEPRKPGLLPSYASDEEREMWRRQPGVRIQVCPGVGHAIPDDQLGPAVRTALAD
jgi:hypothetical protein